MVISCSAYGCQNRKTTNSSLFFHRFPLKNESKLALWLSAVRRENWTPTKYSYLCSDHFTQSDYLPPDSAGRHLLKSTAVHSVFNYPDYLKPTPPSSRRVLKRKLCDSDTEEPSSSTGTSNKILENTRVTLLRRQVRALRMKVRRRDLKIQSMTQLFRELNNRKLLDADSTTILESKFTGMNLELFRNEVKNLTRAAQGRRYNEEILNFAMTLHFYSPIAYNYIRKLL